MASDPGRWGHSLGNLFEVWLPLLDAARPRTVIEVGAYAGDVTRMLLDWARGNGARIYSVDPDPQPALVQLAAAHDELELVTTTSRDALPDLPPPDAAIIDGDHNYYTVSEELRLIAERTRPLLPLIICHDAGWPHGRRDVYYAPETIPAERRQPSADGGFLFPGVRGLHEGGLPYRNPALQEGGPGNGVLTAIEDFAAARADTEMAVVPAFFGLAVLWSGQVSWAEQVSSLLEPWVDNPLLERLEANRVLHLAGRELEAARAAWCREGSRRKDEFLGKLVQSRTFEIAVWLSGLRRRGEPAFSKDEVRELLGG